MNDTEVNIYDMEIFEQKLTSHFIVTRVPGGWIFKSQGINEHQMVFVPFNNEFQHLYKKDNNTTV